MKRKVLPRFSLIISAIAMLYLLYVNEHRGSFIHSDWIVVIVDLSAKSIIELVMMFSKK